MGAYMLTGVIWDWLNREVPIIYLGFGTMMAGIYQIHHFENQWKSIIGGMLIGIIFFVISKCSKEAIGYGDSWMILNLGLVFGLWKTLLLLEIAFCVCFVFSFAGLLIKRLKRKTRIAFFPFLMIGCIGVWNW